ncbi:hypothetical protein DL98DRAFT_528067 [Cadophora sp. DSE1049]|nr:hypothetical protein DL98DRAFT_528067 [Cadophora sp. DSE1049]
MQPCSYKILAREAKTGSQSQAAPIDALWDKQFEYMIPGSIYWWNSDTAFQLLWPSDPDFWIGSYFGPDLIIFGSRWRSTPYRIRLARSCSLFCTLALLLRKGDLGAASKVLKAWSFMLVPFRLAEDTTNGGVSVWGRPLLWAAILSPVCFLAEPLAALLPIPSDYFHQGSKSVFTAKLPALSLGSKSPKAEDPSPSTEAPRLSSTLYPSRRESEPSRG